MKDTYLNSGEKEQPSKTKRVDSHFPGDSSPAEASVPRLTQFTAGLLEEKVR